MIQLISAFFEPLLNSISNFPSFALNKRIRVPLSDAVANKVPFLFILKHAILDSWACIIGGWARLLKLTIRTFPFES